MRLRNVIASRRLSRGVSLVELMVGVAIGLIGVVAIFQAVGVWTKHTQTTSSGGDAQVAGTLALFSLERNMKLAGHGFGRAASSVMGCPIQTTVAGLNLQPVSIVASGPVGSPDTINVFSGNSPFFVEEGTFTDSAVNRKRLPRAGGYRVGDVAVVAGNWSASAASATCQLIEITAGPDLNRWVDHQPFAVYTSFYAASAAPPVTARFNTASAPGFATGRMYNLGPQPRFDSWSVVGGRILTDTEQLSGNATQIAEGVVNLKAEYGFDANGDGIIAPGEWVVALPANPDWKRVLAIRVAVLVRSRQFERNGDPGASGVLAVTPSVANPWYFDDFTKRFLMTNVDGTADAFTDADADPNNWRFYRYRVYQRVIPLRNVLWGTYG